MKQKQIKKKGFSLIEVLFAVLFLSLIVFGVIRLQTSNIILDNTQKNQLKANFYINQGLEVLSGLTIETLSACSNPCYLKKTDSAYTLINDSPELLEADLFERSFTKTNTNLSSDAYLFTAKIKWTDSTGEHKVTGKRVISNN